MKNTVKKVFLFCLLIFAGFQIVCAQQIQSAKFSIEIKNTDWKKGKPVIVNAAIENISDSKYELPTRVDFRLDESDYKGTFYAPFSLTKTYDKSARECQNNLIAENVRRVGGAVEIYPDKNLVSFAAIEKKDFKIDLTGICWAASESNLYPSRNLFETVTAGRYKLYFEMEFPAGMKEYEGIKYPTFMSLISNKIEIEIK
jgi:hypothetical protein